MATSGPKPTPVTLIRDGDDEDDNADSDSKGAAKATVTRATRGMEISTAMHRKVKQANTQASA